MHDALIQMKDGRSYCGPIYMWRPREGWFSIPSDASAPEQIRLADVRQASQVVRVSVEGEEQVDLLERARREGWSADG